MILRYFCYLERESVWNSTGYWIRLRTYHNKPTCIVQIPPAFVDGPTPTFPKAVFGYNARPDRRVCGGLNLSSEDRGDRRYGILENLTDNEHLLDCLIAVGDTCSN